MAGNGSNIKRRLSDANEQADYAIIKMTGVFDKKKVLETAKVFMNEHHEFKGLIIYDKNDKNDKNDKFVYIEII